MRRKKSGKLVLYSALILALLFSVIIFLLVSVVRESHETVTDLYSDNIGRSVELYAERVNCIMSKVSGCSDSTADLLGYFVLGDNAWTMEAMDSIVNSTKAYGVVYYKNDKTMIASTGFEVPDISGYKGSLIGTKHFFHVDDDGVNGTPAFVYSVPIKKDYKYSGYLLAFVSDDTVAKCFEDAPYGIDTFYSIVDASGNVQFIINKTNSTQYFDGGLWDNIQKYSTDSVQWKKFNESRIRKEYATINVNKNGEERNIYMSQIVDSTWVLTMGIDTESIDLKSAALWNKSREHIVIVYVLLFAMLVVLAAITLMARFNATEKNKELESKADTDLLTGLSNKIASERRITEYITKNPDSQAMMIVMDIDNFKKINDTMGHTFGDEVLRNVGQQLKSMFRISDVVGRLGGDEFVILMKDVPDINVIEKEGRKLEKVFQHFEVGEYVKYSVTASIGAAVFPRDAKTFESLYKAADSALYSAKKRGKNQLAFYNDKDKKPDSDSLKEE